MQKTDPYRMKPSPVERPSHLPDFNAPPLNEVVLGVQFEEIPNYRIVDSCKIHQLFENEYPFTEEQPKLEPRYETFGGVNARVGFQLHMGTPPLGVRLWFISKNKNKLLQFQSDRFLVNWRKIQNEDVYPRYENIADDFLHNFDKLKIYVNEMYEYNILVNQAEISYINIIPMTNYSEIGKLFKAANAGEIPIEGISMSFSEVDFISENKPIARLSHEIQSLVSADGRQKAIKYSLTYRGKPQGTDTESLRSFFDQGREKIVIRFTDLTTPDAHERWERK